MKAIRAIVGGLCVAVGIAALCYGGYLSAIVTADHGEPYYVEGFALCVAGLAATALGLWLCGVSIG